MKARILDASSIQQALGRMAHQILERNPNAEHILLVGIGERGEALAKRLAGILRSVEGKTIPIGVLNGNESGQNFNAQKTIILVDDLIFTGRAAHNAIANLLVHESIHRIQLAVLVDSGNRQVPVYADYVGKNIPTAADEYVEVRLKEFDHEEQVVIMEKH